MSRSAWTWPSPQRIWVAGLVAQSALASRALLTGGAVLASRPGQPAAMTAAARDAAAAVPAAAEVLVRGGFR